MSEDRRPRLPTGWWAEQGQTFTEYVLLAGMIVSIWVLAFVPLGLSIRGTLRQLADRIIRVVAGG